MQKTNDIILFHLNELAALQMDSYNGFKDASEKMDNKEMKNFFTENAVRSYDMVAELNEQIIFLGGSITKRGTLKGAINHLWMDIKAKAGDKKNLLDNIIFCEEFNIDRYRQVISEQLPENIKRILTGQLALTENRLSTLKRIKEKENSFH